MDQTKISQQKKDQQDKKKQQENSESSGVKSFTPPSSSIRPVPPQTPNILQRMQALPENEKSAQLKPNLIQQIQRKKEEEKEVQMKKDEDEKPTQMKKDEEEKSVQGKFEQKTSESQVSKENAGAGKKMDEGLKGKMENSFGADFSEVNLHTNSDKAPALNALAFTQGKDIHFAPGQFDPSSQKGQELIGHELTHVLQQQQGKVQPTTQLKGTNVNDSPSLEKEADEMGEKAAKGQPQLKEKTAFAGTSNNSSIQKKENKDPLKVDKGQLTFDAEGNNDSSTRYYSRRAHWPGGVSGVTIGRGYDLGHRGSFSVIKQEMTSVGVDFSKFAGAVGLQGEDAEEWLEDHKTSLPEISLEQQETLFNLSYAALEADVKRISSKEDVVEKYGETNFEKLDPTIRDIVIDLRFRGDYSGTSRKYVQEPMVKNDLKALYEVMKDKNKWKNVPPDRFKRRVEFIEAALGIKGNNNQTSSGKTSETKESAKTYSTSSSNSTQNNKGEYIVKSGESIEILAAKFKTDVAVIKSMNRDKIKQWPTKSGKVVEGFAAGESIKVPVQHSPTSAKPSSSPVTEEKSFADKSFEVLNEAYDYAAESWNSFTESIGNFFSSDASNAKTPTTAQTETKTSASNTTTPVKTGPETTTAKTTTPAPASSGKTSTYSSQRDNKFNGNDIYGSGAKGGNVSADNMCNVTSLAMTLKNYASEHDLKVNTINLLIKGGGYDETKRAELMGFDLEDLIIRRFIQLGPEYFKTNVMGKNFNFSSNPPHQFGACLSHVGKQIVTGISKSLDFYEIYDKNKYKTSVAPELEKGNSGFGGTYLTGGHVVNLVKVMDDGLIINDPYGLILGVKSSYIKNGSKIADNKKKITDNMSVIEKRLKYNSALLAQTKSLLTSKEQIIPHIMGENVFVDWDDVKTFSIFRWLVILKNK